MDSRAITTSSKDPDVSNSHSNFESEAVVVKEDMLPDVSISKTIRQQPITETNGTIPGGAGSVGLPSDSQRLSPDIDSPSGVNELDDEEPAKTSENSAPHTSQAAIAVYDDKRSTPQLLSEAYNLGSSAKPLPRNKAYPEVDAAALPQGVFQEYCAVLGSSRAVGDERSPTVQDRSSNDSYKASSSEKYLTKKIGGRVAIPDLIDLTVSQGEETQRKATASADSLPKERRPAKALHPFFARQATKEHKDKDTNISQLITPITSSHMQVPWPNAENQHNPGPQTSFPSGSSVFGIYRKTPSPVRSPSTSGLRWLNVEDPQPFSSDTHGIGVESRAPTPSSSKQWYHLCPVAIGNTPESHVVLTSLTATERLVLSKMERCGLKNGNPGFGTTLQGHVAVGSSWREAQGDCGGREYTRNKAPYDSPRCGQEATSQTASNRF
ncbi:hypothetical protein JB92DRAFT_2147586 [Gautieria morchelliformis]|nr:hypothetical protein JB92DRAFT_2147586 [Gautieria morchelliformis]